MMRLIFLINVSIRLIHRAHRWRQATLRIAPIVNSPVEADCLVLLVLRLVSILFLLVTAAAELLDILPTSLVFIVFLVLAVVAPSVILLIKELFVSEAGVVVSMLKSGV